MTCKSVRARTTSRSASPHCSPASSSSWRAVGRTRCCPGTIRALSTDHVLQTLSGFTEYATDTLLVLDLVGTFVFALSGTTAGIKHRLDLFGVLVLSFAT